MWRWRMPCTKPGSIQLLSHGQCQGHLPRRGKSQPVILSRGLRWLRAKWCFRATLSAKSLICSFVRRLSLGSAIHSRMILRRTGRSLSIAFIVHDLDTQLHDRRPSASTAGDATLASAQGQARPRCSLCSRSHQPDGDFQGTPSRRTNRNENCNVNGRSSAN